MHDIHGNIIEEKTWLTLQSETSASGLTRIIHQDYDKQNRLIRVTDNLGQRSNTPTTASANEPVRNVRSMPQKPSGLRIAMIKLAVSSTAQRSSIKTQGQLVVAYPLYLRCKWQHHGDPAARWQ